MSNDQKDHICDPYSCSHSLGGPDLDPDVSRAGDGSTEWIEDARYKIKQYLEREVALSDIFPKLPETFASLILNAPIYNKKDFPWSYDGFHQLLHHNSDSTGRDLDVPPLFIDRALQETFWLGILQAACKDQKLPIQISPSKIDVPNGFSRGKILCFSCNDETEIVVFVNLTGWKWLYLPSKTTGHYFRMSAFVVHIDKVQRRVDKVERQAVDSEDEGMDSDSAIENGSNIEYETDSEEDFESVCIDIVDLESINMVGDSKHIYPIEAQNPETLWTRTDNPTNVWCRIYGPKRPGYWVQNRPLMTIRPIFPDKGQMLIRSVTPVSQNVRNGHFLLYIESQTLYNLANELSSAGSRVFEKRKPKAFNRFLTGLADVFERVLYKAGIPVQYDDWHHNTNWAAVEEVDEEGHIPLILRFPGYDLKPGPALTIKLRTDGERNMLYAQTKYEWEEEGPSYEDSKSVSTRAIDQLLGSEGESKVRAAMQMVISGGATEVKVSFSMPADWLEDRQDRKPWLNPCFDLGDLRSYAPILRILAASVLRFSPDADFVCFQHSIRRDCIEAPRLQFDRIRLQLMGRSGDKELLMISPLPDLDDLMTVVVERETVFVGQKTAEITVNVLAGKDKAPRVGQDNFAVCVLKENLRQFSLKTDDLDTLILFMAFECGGEASLKAYHRWKRFFFTSKSEELGQMVLDLVRILCLLTKGGTVCGDWKEFKTQTIGSGSMVREVPTSALWRGIVEGQTPPTPAKQILVKFLPSGPDLMLQFEVSTCDSQAASVQAVAMPHSARESYSQVRNAVLLLS